MTYRNVSPVGIGPRVTIESSSTRIPSDVVYSLMTLAGTSSFVTTGAPSIKSYSYTVPAGRTFQPIRLNVVYSDTASEPGSFGAIDSLATGVGFAILDSNGAVLTDFGGVKMQNNLDWVLLAGVDMLIQDGSPNDAISVRWTLERAGAAMIMQAGEKFVMTVGDDLTGLVSGEAMLQGVLNRSD